MTTLARELWEDLIGSPYVERGRATGGWDCYGIVMEIHRRRGIIIPDIQTDFSIRALIECFAHGAKKWEMCATYPGACLGFGKNGLMIHCGIAIDENRFIHASEKFKSVVVSRLHGGIIPYQSDLLGSYRYVG